MKTQLSIIVADHYLVEQLRDEIIASVRTMFEQRETAPVSEDFLTANEAATLLKVSKSTLNRFAGLGLPYIQKGRKRLFQKSQLLKWIAQ